MRPKTPQNPVFSVASTTLEACRPKVVCAGCGTVITVNTRQPDRPIRCPACDATLRLQCQDQAWTSVVELTP